MDFISDYEGVLLPIEVKSADNTKAKSLHVFCNRYHPRMAVKTSLKMWETTWMEIPMCGAYPCMQFSD